MSQERKPATVTEEGSRTSKMLKLVAFTVDESVCGYMVGTNGSNIRNIEKQFGVEISLDPQVSDTGKRIVTIRGPDAQSVQR